MGLQRVRQNLETKNSKRYSIVYVYHIFIHSFSSGHLGCFRVLTIVNSAALNIGLHVSFGIGVLSGYTPRDGITGLYDNTSSRFLRKLHNVLYNGSTN